MNFGNFNAEEVAKVVYGEGGIFVGKNHDALLAIAQCVYDEWHSGLFGNDLAKILKTNFYGHFRTYDEAKKCSSELSAKGISNFVVKK